MRRLAKLAIRAIIWLLKIIIRLLKWLLPRLSLDRLLR